MKYLLILTLALVTTHAASQPRGEERKEKIEAMKVAFITQELDLTPQEAQQFWPVYNQFDSEMDQLRKVRKTALMDARDNFETMSDADVSKSIDAELHFQQQELDLRKKYVGEFKKVLPTKKVARLVRAEQRFKMKLLQEFKNRKDGPPGPGTDGPPPRPRD